jgi:hypothetical protein
MTDKPQTPSIHAAWLAYRSLLLADEPDPAVVEDCRVAYWAGAATLFYAIMLHGLDEGQEPTDADLARMAAIDSEVEAFARTFDAEALRRIKAAVGRPQ